MRSPLLLKIKDFFPGDNRKEVLEQVFVLDFTMSVMFDCIVPKPCDTLRSGLA